MWAGISWREVTPLIFVHSNMDSVAYVSMLENVLDPLIEEHCALGLIFRQESAAPHTSKFTRQHIMVKRGCWERNG